MVISALVAQKLIPVDDQTEAFFFHCRIVRCDMSSGTQLGSVDFGAHHWSGQSFA